LEKSPEEGISMSARVSRAAALAFALALPFWLVDICLPVFRGAWPSGGFLGALTGLGLLQLTSLSLVVLCLLIVPLNTAFDEKLLTIWRRRKEPGEAGKTYSLSAATCVGFVGFGLALWLLIRLEGVFATAAYTSLIRALAVAASLLLALLVARRLSRLVCRLPGPSWLSPAHLLVVCFGAASLLYALLWWQRDLLFKEIDPWPLLGFSLFGVAVVLVAIFAHRVAAVKPVQLAGSLLFLFSLLLFPGSSKQVAASLNGTFPMASVIASVLRPMADFDGDGVSSWLGGGDCAPFDPMSFPGAVDFPDDGIDQDCFAGDLSSKQLGQQLDPKFSDVAKSDEAQLIVLVSVDALRPDFLGFYGYSRFPSSPQIDAWASGAVVFDDAFTSGPYTTIAIPSMLTGLGMGQLTGYISDLFEERISSPTVKLPSSVETLAEMLAGQGYATGAIVSGFDIKVNAFDQGFKQVNVITPRSLDTADKVTAAARSWLQKNPSGKRFLWLHYFDPHDPYFHDVKPKFGSSTKARYASSIAFMDSHLGPLLSELAEHPSSLVGLVSDHGESLGEKGRFGHGYNLHVHEARMVMAWRGRGLMPRRIQGAASILDVAPTLLNASGGKSRLSAGYSLLKALRGGPYDAQRAVLTESYRRGQHFAVSTAKWRLFYHLDQGRFELYDRLQDPKESNDLAAENPARVDLMRDQLMSLMNRGGTFVRRGQQVRELIVESVPKDALLAKPVRFGDAIELVGYSFGQGGGSDKPQHVATLYLRALRRMNRSWKVAFGMKGPKAMNKDHFPGRSYYPTTQWPPGTLIKDPVILGTMSKFPPSRWSMTLGFYTGDARLAPQPGGGLPLTSAGTRAILTSNQLIKPMPWALERDRKKKKQQLADKRAKALRAKESK
jgi:arylsulfatase A-like enzyme